MKQLLKIGIVVNKNCELPAWEYEMLKQIFESDYTANSVILIANNQTYAKSSFLYGAFTKFENWWFSNQYNAFEKINIKTEFDEQIHPLSETDKLNNLNIDLLYVSYWADVDLRKLLVPKQGYWKIVFGNEKYKSALPPAFWEVMNQEPVTGSSLVIQFAGSKDAITVYEGVTITIPYSVKNNLNSLAWKSSSFLPYRLKELYELGSDLFIEKYKKRISSAEKQNNVLLKAPVNSFMAWLFFKNIFSYLLYKLKAVFNNKRFSILVSNQTYKNGTTDFSHFKNLQQPANTFRADPFLITKENRKFIFFEEFLYAKNKAHISVMELLKDGTYTEPTVALEKPYHLSYPFVFKWENNLYMIPETAANKTVELYRCKQFPDQWGFVMNLMENISLIDCTLQFENGKWWLFACTQNHPLTSSNDQLLLFYSENLFTNNWIAHLQNPVATDISNCRPAGKIFSIDGKLYRPAQNNASQQYGYALKINCIEILNETEYKETEVFEVLPGVGNKLSAVHTINFTDDTIVIDGICKF